MFWGIIYLVCQKLEIQNHTCDFESIFSSRNTIRNCQNKQLLSMYYFELEVNVLVILFLLITSNTFREKKEFKFLMANFF